MSPAPFYQYSLSSSSDPLHPSFPCEFIQYSLLSPEEKMPTRITFTSLEKYLVFHFASTLVGQNSECFFSQLPTTWNEIVFFLSHHTLTLSDPRLFLHRYCFLLQQGMLVKFSQNEKLLSEILQTIGLCTKFVYDADKTDHVHGGKPNLLGLSVMNTVKYFTASCACGHPRHSHLEMKSLCDASCCSCSKFEENIVKNQVSRPICVPKTTRIASTFRLVEMAKHAMMMND